MFAQILEQERERLARKAAAKLPTLGRRLEIPTTLALEQCSSELTAAWKAEAAQRFYGSAGPAGIADLTGGLGIDALAFSKRFARVLYIDRNPQLCAAAQRNFQAAGAGNIRIENLEIDASAAQWQETVAAFAPDLLYLDPARRSASGAKVFRLQDCSPDIAALLPILERLCPRLLLKLSPMADISALLAWAEGRVRELQIIEKDGECKELLLLMDAARRKEEPLIRVVVPEAGAGFDFRPSEERSATLLLASGAFPFLFEPGPALMKAGAFKLLCRRYPLTALSPSVHLYASGEPIGTLSALGKWYSVVEELPFGKEGFKAAGARFPQAEVTARGIPMRSEELRRRCACTGGGNQHIFGVQTPSEKKLIVCNKLQPVKTDRGVPGSSGPVPRKEVPGKSPYSPG